MYLQPILFVEKHRRGESHPDFLPCDFILTEGQEFMGNLIRFGTRFGFRGEDRVYTNTTHFAWVLDESGNLAESLWTGVEHTNIEKYDNFEYLHVRMDASEENIGNTMAFIEDVMDKNFKYGYRTIAGIFTTYLTGWNLVSSRNGTKICSGFGAEGIVGLRRDVIFESNLHRVSPPEINKYVMNPENTQYIMSEGTYF